MSALVDIALFNGDIAVGQKGGVEVQKALQWYIDEYTPVFLSKVLAAPAQEAFEAGLAADEPDAVALAATLRPACARYIWVQYTLGRSSFSAGNGEVYLLGENSERADYSPKVARNWNRMADILREKAALIRAYRLEHSGGEAGPAAYLAPGFYCGGSRRRGEFGGLDEYTSALI